MEAPVRKPSNEPMADLNALFIVLPLIISPENAPIIGPIIMPIGKRKIRPKTMPMVLPQMPYFEPSNFLVP